MRRLALSHVLAVAPVPSGAAMQGTSTVGPGETEPAAFTALTGETA